MSAISNCTVAALDMQSDLFNTAIQGPAMLVVVQLAQAIIAGYQLNEAPIQLGQRLVKPTIMDDIAALDTMTQQLFAKVMEATYAIIAKVSANVIAPVLHMMGPDLSYKFVATHALPKTHDFAAELRDQGLI